MIDTLSTKVNNIAVIGAGASGLFAAAKALECGAKVTVFERNEIVGKKLNITGNGRCNFANLESDAGHYRNPDFIKPYLHQYDANRYVKYFASLGILSYAEKNGCLYPASQKAQSITNGLVHYIEQIGGLICCGVCISEINKNEQDKFLLSSKEKELLGVYDAVILACGGKAAPKTGSDGYAFRLARGFGHTVSRTYPVLVQLKSSSSVCKSCAGIRSRVTAAAYINNELIRKEAGELQITEYGLSGIVTFNLSRVLTKAIEEGEKCSIHIDFLPELPTEEIYDFLINRFHLLKQDSLFHFLEGLFNPKLLTTLLAEQKLNPNQTISSVDILFLSELLAGFKNWIFPLTGHNGYENAQATHGGILIGEIADNLESKLVSNLYFAGEMLDIDADCGGYNLHWAWISGEIAGTNAAGKGFVHDSDKSI